MYSNYSSSSQALIDAIKYNRAWQELAQVSYLDFKDDEGKTAIYYATQKGECNTVESLIELGAYPNIPDEMTNKCSILEYYKKNPPNQLETCTNMPKPKISETKVFVKTKVFDEYHGPIDFRSYRTELVLNIYSYIKNICVEENYDVCGNGTLAIIENDKNQLKNYNEQDVCFVKNKLIKRPGIDKPVLQVKCLLFAKNYDDDFKKSTCKAMSDCVASQGRELSEDLYPSCGGFWSSIKNFFN